MRQATRHWGWGVVVAACCASLSYGQSRPDSAKTSPPTFVADTARHVASVSPEPTAAVTRRSGLRIGAAIVVLTLTTLLLYNVRSR